jgi:hypothetical protein
MVIRERALIEGARQPERVGKVGKVGNLTRSEGTKPRSLPEIPIIPIIQKRAGQQDA